MANARPFSPTERIGEITGPLADGTAVRFRRAITPGQTTALSFLLALMAASGAALLWVLACRSHAHGAAGLAVLAIMLTLETIRVLIGLPVALLAFRAADPVPMRPARWQGGRLPRVAMLTTIVPSKEPIEMVREYLLAALAVPYAGHKDVWLLDEGNDAAVKAMCAELGVRHYSRKGYPEWNAACGPYRVKTKHGNHNAWRDAHEHEYDIVWQSDPDHVPEPWCLERTVGYFNDPDVGFVVAPQVYGNISRSLIARGASQMEYVFQGLVQRGANGLGAPLLIGTNHLYRTRCWQMIGGYRDSIIEDHLTAMHVFAAINPATGNRWRGVYTPDILAVGEGPETWTDWSNQQGRWSWGIWQIICKHSPTMLPRLTRRQRFSYAMLQPYYPAAGLQWLLSAGLTVVYMASAANLHIPVPLWATAWSMSVGSTLGFWFWTHRFNLTESARKASGLTGLGLCLVTIPVYASAALRWCTGRGLPYIVTAKGALASKDRLTAFKPHLTWLAWDTGLLALAGAGVIHIWPLIAFWLSLSWLICATPPGIHLACKLRRQPAIVLSAEPERVPELAGAR